MRDPVIEAMDRLAAARERSHECECECADRLREQRDELLSALAPFARFAERWDRQPLRGMDDEFYAIHVGTEYEARLTLTDCRAALAAIATSKGRT